VVDFWDGEQCEDLWGKYLDCAFKGKSCPRERNSNSSGYTGLSNHDQPLFYPYIPIISSTTGLVSISSQGERHHDENAIFPVQFACDGDILGACEHIAFTLLCEPVVEWILEALNFHSAVVYLELVHQCAKGGNGQVTVE